ncbi:MAG: DinB family protein [Acidobacteria bacterium]|nr:DinB family protein [Acidobacteriota bacterium]
MPLTLAFEELLRYTDEERGKWRRFFTDHAACLELPLQNSDRFSTIGRLIDHIFLVERRHLQRLRNEPVADATGLTGNNAAPLFDYGASVRRELEQFVQEADEDVANQIRTFEVRDRLWEMTPRKLLFHILLHETRHWAQIALALRLSGIDPPGDHDLFYSRAIR